MSIEPLSDPTLQARENEIFLENDAAFKVDLSLLKNVAPKSQRVTPVDFPLASIISEDPVAEVQIAFFLLGR